MTEKPRVVSACMKRIIRASGRAQQKPLISGSVTATLGDDPACTVARERGIHDGKFSGNSVAEVRDGHLLIRWDGPAGYCWKLLLRYLNLTPSEHATYGFNLVRPGCGSPIVTVVVDTETDYHHWITTIAGQLLSQTPLENVKYLDILGIVSDHTPCRQYSLSSSAPVSASKPKKTNLDMQEVNNNQTLSYRTGTRMFKKNVSHLPDLIRECEQSRRSPANEFSDLTPVKQKRMMFEGSLMCPSKSVDNLHHISPSTAKIKSKSMYNLDLSAVPVKDICRYFESRFNVNEKNTIQFRSLH
ncbi:uncharacterized protein LOC112685536 isoform X1 [Sipha flava]|uniref:Uncharacterized protein LOC112685536 isoform X1 n=1 Tax=Sipha flava TaxID=143950 RepID=A0A8B8FRY8_9HEMI|nr:uncharacterized protein LOC112685536 isoform X1 [Sipha flava]